MTSYICKTKLRVFVQTLVQASEWTAPFQPSGQWLGSCRSSKVSCVMCRHACWMWLDSVVRAQMAKRRTKRSESWQGTRWISLLLVIRFSKFWFSSLEPFSLKQTSPMMTSAQISNLLSARTKLSNSFARATCLRIWACRPWSPYRRKTNHNFSERNLLPSGICQCL